MQRSLKQKKHIISKILPGSIAEELEIEPGDSLISIDNEPIVDIFDYQYLIQNEYIEVTIEKPDGEQWVLEIDKDYEEDLGVEFDNGLMDDYRSCSNKCIFCFIDQMPPGMRETLYFKDDDSRLSFLQGNYVTLTNMSDYDLNRIVKYHLSPINISFQTTNPELRCMMLHNRFAGDALKKVDVLFEGGIEMNGQIVLCKGVNDGKELVRSITDLEKYIPLLQSVSVVPVGLSKFRDGLFQMDPFEKEDAIEVLDIIHGYQKEFYEKYGVHFIHASDEWYILAEQELPNEDNYDGYLQLENGVGMLRLLFDEFEEALELPENKNYKINGDRCISIATGRLAYPYIKKMAEKMESIYEGLKIHVYEITNYFFGEKITVSGLLTYSDLNSQLLGKELGETLFLPINVLRSGEDVFLDDYHVVDLANSLQVPVDIVKSSGFSFVSCLLGNNKY